jgi:hypothetical protein
MHNKNPDDHYPDFENLLEDLYSLQKNLLPETDITKGIEENSQALPPSIADEDMQHLEIPILTDVVDSEIHSQRQSEEKFNSAQHHLFEHPSANTTPEPVTDEQIEAVVVKLMARLRPKIDQMLRDKIRCMVKARFNREN